MECIFDYGTYVVVLLALRVSRPRRAVGIGGAKFTRDRIWQVVAPPNTCHATKPNQVLLVAEINTLTPPVHSSTL